MLALVFNITNAVGFTYAWVLFLKKLETIITCLLTVVLLFCCSCVCRDRDAKQKWATNMAASGWSMGFGGIGGQLLSGAVKNSVGRVFGG